MQMTPFRPLWSRPFRMFAPLGVGALVAVGVARAGDGGVAGQLDRESFARLHELIQPRAEEVVWLESIPWRTDLWEARRAAAREGKPIFLWEMDGNPLGCT